MYFSKVDDTEKFGDLVCFYFITWTSWVKNISKYESLKTLAILHSKDLYTKIRF